MKITIVRVFTVLCLSFLLGIGINIAVTLFGA